MPQAKISPKHGRNKVWCNAYRMREQRAKNKAVKLLRHLRAYPDDAAAQERFDGLLEMAKKYGRKRIKPSLPSSPNGAATVATAHSEAA